MKIEVNYAKRDKAEEKRYTNKGMVRVPSAFEKEHVLIQINVCGLVSGLAETVITRIVAKLGMDNACLLSASSVSGNGGQYDDVEMIYTDWLCIDKAAAGNGRECADTIRSEVRKAAKAVKAETKKTLIDPCGSFYQEVLAF